MTEKQNLAVGGVATEPDTEEWLTDSETEQSEALYPVSQSNCGISLVSSVPVKFGTTH